MHAVARGEWLAIPVFVAACGLSNGGLGAVVEAGAPDSSATGPDGGADAESIAEDGGGSDGGCTPATCPNGACCGEECVPPSCAGCSVGGHFCPSPSGEPGGVCLAACGACATFGATASSCYTCGDAGLAGARCAAAPTDCAPDLEAGACACASGTAEECPGPLQVCSMVNGAFVCLSQ
jgi:hypothetical protein